ncbi:MAG: prolyl oligopeptidase family serine peptidase [Gammaproteobacteria bacterium]|nr:prolyl oligopeptidase family serine peptidase [Gammaproteobacteria bacterium]
MQDDLLDGLDHLVAEGIADPDRVCVVGGSYGGFAALLAAFRDAGRIRCAVSYAGVSDLDALEDYWRSFRFGGVSAARLPPRAARQELSPLANADRIAIPLLVLHGAEDRVVKVEHSRRLVEALGAADVAVRYVEQPHGDHHLMREADRVEFLRELDAFLGRHLLADDAD